MEINKVIVHSVKKEQHSSDVEIDVSGDELVIDNRVTALLDGITNVYTKKTGKAFAKLEENRFFSGELQKLYDDDISFLNFSHVAINEFKSRISLEPLATGGYLVFSDFNKNQKHYFMIIMLKSKDGLSFNEELKLTDAKHIDLEKLHFAARIDLGKWQSNDENIGNYVSFVKGRSSSSVTLYFKEYLGIKDFSESSKITQDLVTAVTNFYRVEKEFDNEKVEEIKIKVHNYCKEKHENETPIFLNELSRYLDEEEPVEFMNYAQENYEIPNEFQVDKQKLRRFLRYSGKDKDVSISFTSEAYGTRVIFEDNILTIRDIPKSLKAQLIAEMNSNN